MLCYYFFLVRLFIGYARRCLPELRHLRPLLFGHHANRHFEAGLDHAADYGRHGGGIGQCGRQHIHWTGDKNMLSTYHKL